jgi:purine-nucleoside phosphorylase
VTPDPSLKPAVAYLTAHGVQGARMACVLGSGLGSLAGALSNAVAVNTSEVPGFPRQTVEGHKGRIISGSVGGCEIIVLQGRTHIYETGDLQPVLFPVRLLAELGIKTLILTNAAGGISAGLDPGDLMVITDHVNLTLRALPASIGKKVGARCAPYAPGLLARMEKSAIAAGVRLKHGIYAGVLGPAYETPAEIEMLRRLGADAVGMSTVWEAIYGSTLGLDVAGVSCITNKAAGLGGKVLTHEEVTRVGERTASDFSKLLTKFVELE